jgi:5-methylcytosine-specific restriction protein A
VINFRNTTGCGLNFEQTYGEIGRNFIEVHHVKPISEKGGSYEIDPRGDLVPLCPNCHRMIHRGEGAPLSVEELRLRLKNVASQGSLS